MLVKCSFSACFAVTICRNALDKLNGLLCSSPIDWAIRMCVCFHSPKDEMQFAVLSQPETAFNTIDIIDCCSNSPNHWQINLICWPFAGWAEGRKEFAALTEKEGWFGLASRETPPPPPLHGHCTTQDMFMCAYRNTFTHHLLCPPCGLNEALLWKCHHEVKWWKVNKSSAVSRFRENYRSIFFFQILRKNMFLFSKFVNNKNIIFML